jgi:hypothetical protein
MTDSNQIAQRIACTIADLLNYRAISQQDANNFDAVIKEIAAALVEYGAAYARLCLDNCEKTHLIIEKEADAEGYRRGVEEVCLLASWET